MGRVTGSFSRPIQGVSQQPAKVRLDGQCEVSDNFRPDVVQGLITRPSTRFVSEFLNLTIADTSKVYYYNRGDSEEYFIITHKDGEIEAFSPNGTRHLINITGTPKSYTSCDNAQTDLDLVTIGDFTFISNNKRVVRASSESSPVIKHQAVVYVQFMDFAQTQSITVDGNVVATYNSPDGSNASHKDMVGTEYVADRLHEQLVGYTSNGVVHEPELDPTVWTVTKMVSCIFIERKDKGSFTLITSDDAGGSNLKGVKAYVKNISDLPPRAPSGMQVEVRPPGSTSDSNNRYWLSASEADNSDNVIWNESLAPNIKVGVDLSTMPHVLVRESVADNGVATFTYRAGEWQNRDVGDDDNNPLPSFVDAAIHNIGIFQNRLYLTSNESVTMTRTSNFFNFFRTTTQSVLDTDPIDIYADAQKVNILKASSALDGDLIFFSDSGQFRLPGSAPITPGSAAITQETQFQSNTTAPPAASGENLFFAFDYGQFVGIREFYTDNVTDTKRARPITEHVSRYIPGRVKKMASSSTVNTLVVQSDKSNTHLYIYDWLWQGAEKVQSAWGRWSFSGNYSIKHFIFNRQSLYLLLDRGGHITLEVVDMGDPDDSGLVFPVRLDMMYKTTATFSSENRRWEIADRLPFVEGLIGVRGTGCYSEEVGQDISLSRSGGLLVTEDELSDPTDGSTVDVFIGRPYDCMYVPNQPVIKDQYDKPIGIDKLTLGVVYMNYERVGSVSVTVEDLYGRQTSYRFNGRIMSGPSNVVGFAPEQEGSYRIPIRQKADQVKLSISTNSHRPLQIRDFEYEGYWRPRGQRR